MRPAPIAVLSTTRRSNRSGASVATRIPIGPPQSWTTTVIRRRSSASTSAWIDATWRSYEYHAWSVGLSERPKP